jgi:ketosteroid isomerase-like protein
MRGLLTFLAALVAATPALAQAQAEPAQDAISAVRSFTDAFDRGDEAGMTSVITPDAQVVLVRPQEDADVVRSLPLADLAARIAGSPADLKEPIAIKNVMVDGPVAMVWADFSLFVDGARSHCGVDIFTLVQADCAWKIAHITYSHITEPCDEAPAL